MLWKLNILSWLGGLLMSGKRQNAAVARHYPNAMQPTTPSPATLDARTEATLETLHPAVRGRFRAFAADAQAEAARLGYRYIAINGNRSLEAQAELFNRPWDGKDNDGDGLVDERDEKVTNARPGSSWHNFGLAVDFGCFNKEGSYLDQTAPKAAEMLHRRCALFAQRHGIEWGGDFKNFVDLPHYQFVPPGLTLEIALRRRNNHQDVLTGIPT